MRSRSSGGVAAGDGAPTESSAGTCPNGRSRRRVVSGVIGESSASVRAKECGHNSRAATATRDRLLPTMPTNPNRLRRVLRAGAVVLTLLVVAGLVRAIRRDGPAALSAWRAAHVRWEWMSLSVALALAGHLIYVLGWRRLLGDSGVRVGL